MTGTLDDILSCTTWLSKNQSKLNPNRCHYPLITYLNKNSRVSFFLKYRDESSNLEKNEFVFIGTENALFHTTVKIAVGQNWTGLVFNKKTTTKIYFICCTLSISTMQCLEISRMQNLEISRHSIVEVDE